MFRFAPIIMNEDGTRKRANRQIPAPRYSARVQIQVPLTAATAAGISTHGQPSVSSTTTTLANSASSAETLARRPIARRSRQARKGGP